MESPDTVRDNDTRKPNIDAIRHAAQTIIERSIDPSITAEARRIVHLTRELDRHAR